MHIKLKNNHLYFYNYKIKCSIGKKGITAKKREGDYKTPSGKFKFKFLLFRNDRIKGIRCKIKKIKIKKNMGWCDDPTSKKYNRIVKLPFKKSAEKLYIKKNYYDLLLVIDYNMKPVISGKGSAIFLHLASKNFSTTKGCIAIKKREFLQILPYIEKKTKLFIY
tara:strand:- start:3057 stop:3548 length:492 start_codon:yes stop_codon:yes gene_type:complete